MGLQRRVRGHSYRARALTDIFHSTFASFMDQPENITHVALVKPKLGLFIDDISELLVICTNVSVLLIGVALTPATGKDGRPRKELNLYATDLTVSTDIEMTSVIGTPDGRIFMCGIQDGNLYELHYQANESWFGKRVQLINHSVGGVSSLLPRFASSAGSEGRNFPYHCLAAFF
jgi:nuclear pore complex protein Nup155